MKPHPTKSKPRIAKGNPPHPFDAIHAKPSPRQPVKEGRVMWMHPSGHQVSSGRDYDGGSERPVLVLDLSPEARERRVEAGAKTISDSKFKPGIYVHLTKELKDEYRGYARAVLASLGDGEQEGGK